MDQRQHNQEYIGNNPQRVGGNFGFNGGQNDPFNSFASADNENAFDAAHWNQTFPAHQQSVNGFGHGNHVWQQNPYQSSSMLQMPNYGVQPGGGYDQAYSRSPAPFNYPSFDSNPSQVYSPPAFDNAMAYGQMPLNNSTQYDYPGQQNFQQSQETISPQALQNYPIFPQNTAEENRQSQHSHYDSSLPVRRASATGPVPTSDQDWIKISSITSDSMYKNGLRVKPTAALENVTKSSRVDGFTFVGSGNLAFSSTKASVRVSRQQRKRSMKELNELLHREKGNDPWLREREPLVKKLKTSASKVSRPVATSTHARGGSAAESASPSGTSDSESEDDSEYYSESEKETEPEEPSPLPTIRPADPSKAVEFDIIKAVWAKRSVGLSGTVIRTALGEYWNIFKGVRDKWKSKTTSLQQAIEKKDQANSKAYERRVLEQRRLLESCIRLTLKHGHPDIIEKLGENPALFVVFYQFLADRFKDSEYTGTLIASILEARLMTRCVTVDQSVLEKTKMDKVLPRLVKRGDDQGKVFAQQILDNAAAASKQKNTDVKALQGHHPNGTAPKPLSGGSRPSDPEAQKSRPVDARKLVSAGITKGSGVAATTKSGNPSAKADSKAATKMATMDSSKVKANHITAKPSGFFSSLQSASKKPGTSSKSKDGKISTGPENKTEVAAEPPKPAFSFAATMANLTKQKEAPPTKSEEARKPETPEEKSKRLRKEERRKLRVSFKADDELVQVREFMHDPEEDSGHEDSQVRDVGDSRGEGQMLKMHKDLDLMDEDEDYEPPEEVFPDWVAPHPVDFSVVDEGELARNYTSRGGKAEVKSAESAAQEQRELSTLMVVYTTPSDIPPSPREPSDLHSGETVPEESFGEPSELTKEREEQYHARQNSQPATAQAPTPDISALLRILNSQQPSQPPPQPQQPVAPAPATGLEAVFAQFAGNSRQQAPPMPIPQPQQQPAPAFNLQAALATMSLPNQTQSGYTAPPQSQAPDLQSILAQIGRPAQQTPQVQGYGYPNTYQNENDRKRQFEPDDGDYGYGKGKRPRGSGGPEKKKQYYGPPRLPCKFFQEGKCRKGDDCTFLHEM